MSTLELAEMVVNGELEMEDALKLTKDEEGLIEAVRTRRSMRYAMQAMIYWKKTSAVLAERTSALCSMNACKGWIKRYQRMANRLIEKISKSEAERYQDAAWRWGKEWVKDDIEFELDLSEDYADYLRSNAEQSREFARQSKRKAEEREYAAKLLEKEAKIYGAASFTQALGELLEDISNAILY